LWQGQVLYQRNVNPEAGQNEVSSSLERDSSKGRCAGARPEEREWRGGRKVAIDLFIEWDTNQPFRRN